MPNPTPGQVHVDGLLTDVSVAFVQSSTKFVADKVFPRVPVQKQSDKVAIYNQQDFMRVEAEKRAPGDSAVRVGYRTSSTTYIADEWAAEHAIDDQVRANADSPYAPGEDAVRYLVNGMQLRREKEWVTNFFSTGNLWTGSSDAADLVGATDFTQWSNAASTPIEDIRKAANRIERASGFRPNKLVVDRYGESDLLDHPDIVDRIKHVSSEPVTRQLVARLMGLDEVLVTAAAEYSGGEGLSTAAGGSFIASDEALLVYAPPAPSLMTPSGGYTFVWSGLTGSNEGQVVEQYRDDKAVSDVVRVRAAWAQKRIAPSLGVLFTDTSTRV